MHLKISYVLLLSILYYSFIAFIIPPPPRAPPASVESTPARKFSSSFDKDLNEIRVSRQLKETEQGSREGSKDKISPKIASIQQQLVNLTSPTNGETPSSFPNNDVENEDREQIPASFKIKSDTLSRKKLITNNRESRSLGKEDTGFSYKGEVGIPPPPPPPRSSIPKGFPSSSAGRNFTNNISLGQSGNTRPANPATFKLPLRTETEASPAKKSPNTSSPMSNSKLRNTSSSDSLSSNASVNTVKSVSPMEDRNKNDVTLPSKTTFGVKLSPIKDTQKKEPIMNNDDDEDSNPPSLPPRLSSPLKSPSKQPPPPPPLSKSLSKDRVAPPSPKPTLPSREKKPSPVHTTQGNSQKSPSSGSVHNLANRSLPQLPKPTSSHKSSAAPVCPKTSPKLGPKFGGHKVEQNGSNGFATKVPNGVASKYKDEEKPILPMKTLSSNDRSSAGRRLPIPPPTNSVSGTNGHTVDSKKVVANGTAHLTNGHANHESIIPPTPPSPRSKPRGVSGSPLRINQSPNKTTSTTTIVSSTANTPTRKFEFGSKKNGFVEGSFKNTNGHVLNGQGSNGISNGKLKSQSFLESHTNKNEESHQHHSEVYLNSHFDIAYGDGTSVDGDEHVDYNDQHDNEVSYVVQNGVNGKYCLSFNLFQIFMQN